MLRKLFLAITLAIVLLAAGCSSLPDMGANTASDRYQILKKAELGNNWQMYQMKIDLAAEQELDILLRLANGDKVDGYFFLEEGDTVAFEIAGNSVFYKSANTDQKGNIKSDRFSFTASQAQGTTYTLTFKNEEDKDSKSASVSVFCEVILPASASIYIPIEPKSK